MIPGVGPYPLQESFLGGLHRRRSPPGRGCRVADHGERQLHRARHRRPPVSAMGFDKKWYGPREGPDDGPTELSWGEGMVPPGAEHAPPRGYPGDPVAR